MRILIDIGHPAHVHLFRNFAKHLISKKHDVLFTVREKEFEIQLLKHFQLPYNCLGRHYNSKPGKIWGLVKFTLQIFFISLRFKPGLYLSHGSFYAAISSWLLRKIHISFEDTFNYEQIRLYKPFTDCILTGNYPHPELSKKQIEYAGYHELAYLHPNHFHPDISVKKKLGLIENEKYFIVRFVSWGASHDKGQKGLNFEQKKEIINILSLHGKVFISSEKKLPAEFEKHKFPLTPDRMHDALAYAELFVSEGATMASECAVLGTTSIYINSMEAGSINEQEKFGLIFHFRNDVNVIEKVKELLSNPNLKTESLEKSKKLIAEEIDVTAFLVWFAENYPQSKKIMKKNPDYQYNFK